ncbi:MAG TPA: tRNA (guanine(10)-N(2))-dimethyltransferase, partial [Candidatus Altiarchaeales archaeon]|nr:tRNA (guanine(10)-N(2))-dimethyltransferase [Candidatus Altiarchaeales archaeon]
LLVPKYRKLSKKNLVFFNPEMKLNRDISVAITGLIKPKNFCDALAGSGARGIRIANETNTQVVINDKNPTAHKLMKKNAELNSLGIRIENQDAITLLSREKFDFIDIDPFGSPVKFIDSALSSITNKGILSVTATDTSALCGTYPKACRRKYDSISLRTGYYNELGLRILIGYLARSSFRHGKGIKPLFSHCTRHYLRTYLKIYKSNSRANENLKNIAFIKHCFNCLNREFSDIENLTGNCNCGHKFRIAGPLWTGEFADEKICDKLMSNTDNRKALNMVGLIKGEQKIKIPYYDIHKIFKKLKIPALPMEEIESRLKERYFIFSRTHFTGTGIRTDAKASDLYNILLHIR